MDNNSKIASLVVNQDLCIGCGLCSVVNPSIKMLWDKYGFLIPDVNNENPIEIDPIRVCPFNPYPENKVKTEDELSSLFLKNAPLSHPQVGRYYNTYAGYSHEFRLTSSSGGLATYILTELIERGIVQHVISVKLSTRSGYHYEYAISSDKDNLIKSAATKYFPVTLSEVLQEARQLEGKIAIVGVGCFVKGIRLLQYYDSLWREKIGFIVGIICGGVKSRFFTEYLVSKSGVSYQDYHNPEFRIKDLDSAASDYSFGCLDSKGEHHSIKMKSVGDMWGTGMFKNNACDFCDDVTTELADISLGDAWLQPYASEGKGTNVLVSRSAIAEHIIREGINNGNLHIEVLPVQKLISSQQGSFNHRQNTIAYRIKKARHSGKIIPPKRYEQNKISLDLKWVQNQRMKIRKLSLEQWLRTKNSLIFDKQLYKPLHKLKQKTLLNHYIRRIRRRLHR